MDRVALEERPPWQRSCVVVSIKGRELFVHIAVHRKADEKERETLAALDQAAVEIDLTRQFPHTVAELARILFTADPRKSWLFNHRQAQWRVELEEALTAKAHEQRQAQQDAIKAQHEQWRRERADRDRLRAEALAAQRELIRQRLDAAAATTEPPPPQPGPAKPAEMSPSIEYRSREGRLWLLHSSQPEVYFRIEPGLVHALQVLERCGAIQDGSGAYRISREGWSSATIELGGSWLAIGSVSGATEPAQF